MEALWGPQGVRFSDVVVLLAVLTEEDFKSSCPGPFLLEIPVEALRSEGLQSAGGVDEEPTDDGDDMHSTGSVPTDEEGFLTRQWDADQLVSVGRKRAAGAAKIHYLGRDKIVIGRESTADIVITNHALSRKHVEVSKASETRWDLVDLGSRNGTFINGEQLTAGMNFPLKDGVRVRMGAYRSVVVDAAHLFKLAARLRKMT